MSTQNLNFSEESAFQADLGDYREIKVKGLADEVHGVRIDSGEVWDMDYLITHGLTLDGLVFVRRERILNELNTDRYDKVNFLLSLELEEWPDLPRELPMLDEDRLLFNWLCAEQILVMVFVGEQRESVMGWVKVAGDKSFQMRLLSDELEVTEELLEFDYSRVPVVVTGTHLLRLFEKYLELTA